MSAARDPSAALAGAGLAAPSGGGLVRLGDREVTIAAERTPAGIRLRCALPDAGERQPLREMAAEIASAEAGDTALSDDGSALERTVVDPGPARLRDAAVRLAKAVLLVEEAAAFLAEGETAGRTLASATPPDFSRAEGALAGLRDSVRWMTVPSPQPAWRRPDPSKRARARLRPGRRYQLVERRGDWAMVLTEGRRALWTDGRTLTPAERSDEP